MAPDRMELIDEEITLSNARKFGKSSIARANFSKQYTQQWYTDVREHITSMSEYQRHVDVAAMTKPRLFYTSCDVHAEWGPCQTQSNS